MMTCKEVSTLMSKGSLADAPGSVRLAARLHLAMCRRCRAFKRQLETLTRTARSVAASFDQELPKEFESTVAESLHRRRSS